MCNIQRAGFVLVLASLAASASVAAVSSDLVAYWPFNGDATDASGNGHYGVVHGPILIPDWSGCPDSAYHFDGINDYINIGNKVKPPLPLTISLWLRVDDFGKSTRVFRNDQVNHGAYRYGLDISVVSNGNIGTNLYEGFSAPWNRRSYYPDSPPLKDNSWHHVCVVYRDLNSISIYVDGHEHSAPLSSGSGSGMSYRGYGGAIGHHIGNQAHHRNYFPGSIDEVRVYNRALSSEEVELLLELPPCPDPEPIHVDDDAANDPGPNDSIVSDPEEDGTEEHPFDMIQEGIDAASEGATVLVREGTYYETIEFMGKNIDVTSFDPNGDKISDYPVIDAGYSGTVVTFNSGEDANCTLSGFVLTRGLGESVSSSANGMISGAAAAIVCIDASPRVGNCVIVGNNCTDPHDSDPLGGIVYCVNSDSIFENCTITDNYAGTGGTGMYFIESGAVVANCIIWGNMPEEIAIESGDAPIVSYSNVLGGWPGLGNTDVEPGFAFPGYWADLNDLGTPIELNHPDAIWLDGDYHLMSTAGRWDPTGRAWAVDESRSLCIDAGDPDSPWENEPEPNGGRINLGAYGGASQASMSTDQCCLTISSTEGGAVIEPGEGTFCYDCGTRVAVETLADEGYQFVRWTGTGVDVGKVDPCHPAPNLVMDGDYTLEAHFVKVNYVLTIGSEKHGSVTVPGEGEFVYDCGTSVPVEAVADEYCHFTVWTGTAVNAGKVVAPDAASTTVTVDGDYTLHANFACEQRILSVSSTAGGSLYITVTVDNVSTTWYGGRTLQFDHGTEITLMVFADPGYEFANWSGTMWSRGDFLMFGLDQDFYLTANFREIPAP